MNQQPSPATWPQIVLASASPRRQELLHTLQIPFVTEPSEFDESTIPATHPAQFVEQLAYHKASAIAAKRLQDAPSDGKPWLVIGADTVVVKDGRILGKPLDADDAQSMLTLLQGAHHHVFTGLCVIRSNPTGGAPLSQRAHEATKVYMRGLTTTEIARYVATGEPLDKAGAYAIQGIGATLIDGIEGDYFAVVGLPLHRLAAMLREFGIFVP